MDKSPAQEAGFIPGDIVIGVENNLRETSKLTKHCYKMQVASKVIINRKGG